jgi:glycosyltransferase involved in cell wall biosynthesis
VKASQLTATLKICVVVPCHNEEAQVVKVITTLPDEVAHICVIDDCSTDRTAEQVQQQAAKDARIHFIKHEVNQGVGGAIATGYKWARDNDVDIAIVMAGDGQMAPSDLPALMKPVIEGQLDYAKGNRLFHQHAYRIPRVRFLGNSVLSLLTKIASGYWHISDSQCGYTAINRKALHLVDWDKMYKRYGMPNDLLVRLNVHNMRVGDVEVEPIYGMGERSGFRSHRMIVPIGGLLLKRFLWRLKEKYVLKDFHPLVLFYFLALTLGIVGIVLFVRLIYLWIANGFAPPMTAIAFMFTSSMALQSLFFGMWMDMEANKPLR